MFRVQPNVLTDPGELRDFIASHSSRTNMMFLPLPEPPAHDAGADEEYIHSLVDLTTGLPPVVLVKSSEGSAVIAREL